jgi:hypothetical protein
MKNLACRNPDPKQVEEITETVNLELRKAGIPQVPRAHDNGEVPALYSGRYESFIFERAWYYWVVEGMVPLAVAEELYANPNGERDIRVNGHCGCPAPAEWAVDVSESGQTVASDEEFEMGLRMFRTLPGILHDWETNHIPKSKAVNPRKFITSYHIDTQEGLNFFMDTIRKHGLTGKA